jgi:hypothetical protein
MSDLDRKVAQAMGLKSVNNCEEWSNSKMKDPEDEAFEELALKQGQWHHISGWRKRQIERDFAAIDDANNIRKRQIAHMDVHSHPAEFVHLHRNDTIEEIAQHLETKFTGPFGRDTVQSFVAYIRGMKL